MPFCRHCGSEISIEKSFCRICGEKRVVCPEKTVEQNKEADKTAPARFCRKCGTKLEPGKETCRYCDTPKVPIKFLSAFFVIFAVILFVFVQKLDGPPPHAKPADRAESLPSLAIRPDNSNNNKPEKPTRPIETPAQPSLPEKPIEIEPTTVETKLPPLPKSPPVAANFIQKGYLSGDDVNLRKTPEVRNGNKIALLDKFTKVEIIENAIGAYSGEIRPVILI